MKPSVNNPYGYKICFKKKRVKNDYVDVYRVHSFNRAMKIKRDFAAEDARIKKKNDRLWHVIPITKKEVGKGIWKRPF